MKEETKNKIVNIMILLTITFLCGVVIVLTIDHLFVLINMFHDMFFEEVLPDLLNFDTYVIIFLGSIPITFAHLFVRLIFTWLAILGFRTEPYLGMGEHTFYA